MPDDNPKKTRKRNAIDKATFERLVEAGFGGAEICSLLGRSQPALNAFCKREYGCTFAEYSGRTGRPIAAIDRDDFEKLCSMMCSEEEIAGFFGVHIDTLNEWCKRVYGETFAEASKPNGAKSRISLRRQMLQQALNGDRTLLIWLSKQYLGMREDPDKNKKDESTEDRLDRMIESLAVAITSKPTHSKTDGVGDDDA